VGVQDVLVTMHATPSLFKILTNFILGEIEELTTVMISNIVDSRSIGVIFFPITYIRILVNVLKSISITSPNCTKTTHFYNIICQVSRHELRLMQMDHGDAMNI
jgi:hypothetical protein